MTVKLGKSLSKKSVKLKESVKKAKPEPKLRDDQSYKYASLPKCQIHFIDFM